MDFAPPEVDPANSKPVSKTISGETYTDNVPGEPIPIEVGGRAGTLTALDPLRWINTTPARPSGNAYRRAYNCRDLGGWPGDVIRVSGLNIDGTGVVAVYDDAQTYLGGTADFERNRSYSGNLGTVSIDADGDLTWTYDADTDQAIAYVRVSGPLEEGSAFTATKNEPLPEP